MAWSRQAQHASSKIARKAHSSLPQSCADAPLGRPPRRVTRGRLLARVPLTLLELFHDLIQVVARRILKRGELLVGFQLLEPQHLADGQQVPVVDVGRDRPGERAAEPEIRLFLVAPRRLEWIALEVYHAGCELGLDSRQRSEERR